MTIDNKVKTDVEAFLATDNIKGGSLAADKLVEGLKANTSALQGKVTLISAMAGIQVLASPWINPSPRRRSIPAPGTSGRRG